MTCATKTCAAKYRVVALALLLSLLAARAHPENFAELRQAVQWGESRGALLAHFGGRVTVLPRPLDFGDSYADVVLRDVTLGGVPLIAYFQMDKRTGGLKRIQFERPRHGVNPPVFRAILAALEADYGSPDLTCGIRPGPAGGYQAAADRIWVRDGVVIRAVFRGTSLEALEGCVGGDLTSGPCGLTAQLLVRVSPPGGDAASCPAPRARSGGR